MAEMLKQKLTGRLQRLKNEQSSWREHWREISEQIQPRRARFNELDATTAGRKMNDKIINNTPLIAMRVAASGIMAGLTSPARQWFKVVTADPDAMKYSPVKNWIYKREQLMALIIAKSNAYNSFAGAVYPDLLAFGTHATFLEEDVEEFIRLYPQATGEYYLAVNFRGVVDTLFREIPLTVRQLVDKFGVDNCTEQTKQAYEQGTYDKLVTVIHAVCPNQDYAGVIHPYYGKKFASYWWEKSDPGDESFLKKAGYDRFPVLAPRWALTNSVSDVYGFSPGMDALGDCKELQHLELRKAMLVDKLSAPPLGVPEEMKTSRISLIPGETVYIPRMAAGAKVEPIMTVPPQGLMAVKDLIQEVESRVGKGFYTDLWLQIIQDERLQPRTAREIAERHEEKMLQLGPVVERLENEFLDPLLDYVFQIIDDRGLQPPPPEDIQGMGLKIEYISIMAQAQRLVNVSATEKFVSFALGFAQARPTALDVLNVDVIVQRMAQQLGVDPEFIRDEREVEAERQARAEKEQAAQMGGAMVQGARGIKDASQGDVAKIQDLAQMMTGPVAASAAGVPPPGGMPSA